ncbi:hypothetical protein BS47DRAFT_1299400, partial [Hydnum rufescens UP504]
CACKPAAVQLVNHGVFPCAPVHPTLAVDIGMLELVAGLFVHLAPNKQAWMENLYSFLKKRHYWLHTSVHVISCDILT